MTFFDSKGNKLGDDKLQPIPLFKGMTVTIHGYDSIFKVIDWNYHHGHPDEDGGLRIILEEV